MAENNFSALVKLIVDKAQARSALQRELKELQREAQLETDVKVNLSDVRQARKEIEKANREQQQGTRENIKLRAQELAHARMVAKETKVATDLEIANRQREMKLSNQAMSEELANRKRVAQEQKVATQEELASRESIRKLNEQTFKEESSARKQAIAEMRLQAQEQRALKSSVQGQANKIQLSFDNGHGASDYGNRIKEIENNFVRYGLSVDEASQKTETLRAILSGFKDTDGNFLPADKLVAQADKLEAEFKAVKISVDEAKLSYDKFLQPVSSEKASSLIIRINDFLTKNTAITKDAKEELQGFVRLLKSGNVNLSDWNKFDTRLKEINQEMRNAGKLGKSLKQTLIDGAKSFAQWTLSSGAVMNVVQGFRNMYDAVYDIDTAMTNLYKVTDETDERYNKFLESACDNAQRLGRSVSSLVEQTANWSKLGYSLDDAEKLAEVSSIYANVAEVSDDTAVSDLVTAMKAFNLETSEAITIADKLNALGNKYATSAADLGTGLANSASALALAGNDIDETLAMITAMTEITQDASESGNALKILSMRLRGMKGELEALGEESEGIESISKIQTQILNLTGGKVNIFDNTGNFKSTYEIMQDISEVWTEISQTDQAALLEIIAGKQRGNSISALLTNMAQANNALNDSINSSGSAYEEQERWMESLEAKTQRFEAAFQSLSNTLLDSDLLGFFVDFGTGAVNAIDTVVDKVGTLGTLATIGSGILGAKGSGLTNYVTQS